MSRWDEWRAEFPILARKNYLNSCSLGALSRRAESRLDGFLDEWHAHGASAWYETWMGRLADLRGRVAGMIGADGDEVALVASVSAGLATVGSAVDYRERKKVVVAELDFPTLAYQWMARPDIEVVRVPSDDGATISLDRWADAVDDRTAILATSHVFYATGAIQDLGALADIAHRAGALFLVDAYQGIGQVPVGVREADIDVLIAGPLKWLMGGPGLAYTYVRRELISRLRPTVTGWFATADQFTFDIENLVYKDDARRFELGTPALHTVHTALGGQEIVDEIGVPAIRARDRQLTEHLIDRAAAAGFRMRRAPDPDARSAIVMIAVDDPKAAIAHLDRAGIIGDARPGHVRLSPHFYNTEEEIDAAIAELAGWRDAK